MEGTKYDDGKPRLGEMLQDFDKAILELCKVWTFGADKYDVSNWKLVDDGFRRYTNALLRHLIVEKREICDKESHLLHATHVAWNALARLYLLLEQQQLCEAKPFIVEVPSNHTDYVPIVKQ